MEPIRVLHVVGKMHAGGLESLIMNLYRHIDRNKVQFDFITHYSTRELFDDEIERLGGKIYRFTVREDNNIFKYRKELNRFFKDHSEYKIIHGHLSSFGFMYLRYAGKANVPVRIAHSHIASYTKSVKGIGKKLLAAHFKDHATNLFACSRLAGNYMFGENSEFTLINNGIDVDKYKFASSIREKMRSELKLQGKFVVGHVGRFDIQKNHEFLLDVFFEVKKRKNNAILILVGVGMLYEEIKKKAEDMGITDSVLFMGVREDVSDLYQVMDTFLFPSFYEGLPLTLIEAQSSGLPVLCSNSITDETNVSPVYKSLPLEIGAEKWAKHLLELDYSISRESNYKFIINNGYDIKDVAKKMEKTYIEYNLDK